MKHLSFVYLFINYGALKSLYLTATMWAQYIFVPYSTD